MLYSFENRKPGIGKDTYVSESALVIGDVRIGDNCYIGHSAILIGDSGTIEIGNGSAIEEGVIIHTTPGGMCWIGEKVTIAHGAIVHSEFIGDFVLVGMGAILSLGTIVGEYSIVAEGAVVKRGQTILEGLVVAGNPAATVREVTGEEKNRRNRGQFYADMAKKYLDSGMQRLK